MHMTPRTIIIGGLAVVLTVVAFVVFLPYAVFDPEPTETTFELSPLAQEGRDLYVSNGCVYCHSQFTRPADLTTSKPSRAGEFAYDKPHQLGTLRTGPDLANIGHKRGDDWEKEHFKAPRDFTPNSIMPSFSFLSDHQLDALVAYLNTLGNKETATTDLMIPERYLKLTQPNEVTAENWDRGREIYVKRCLTCHGCAGKGDGPYAYLNNARPADLRQPRFKGLPTAFLFWRTSEGVPGTVMPPWKKTLSQDDRWLVELFVQHAFMDAVPHLTDEGDLPAEYDKPSPIEKTVESLDEGKAIFVANCTFCHGYSGAGDGPDAKGLAPAAPNFIADNATLAEWKPGDFFWRVSESLPMRAMPQWKLLLDERQRWLVADYVRHVLVSPPADAEPADPEMPANVDGIEMPADVDIMHGRSVYLKRCWMCHGDAGQGEGPEGIVLVPPPVDFTDPGLKEELKDADWFWRVTSGIGNSGMPIWGLLLSPEERWDAIHYVRSTFLEPTEPEEVSDKTPVEYQALEAPWPKTPEAVERGKADYDRLCAGCHGAKGLGDGTYGAPLMPTPANLAEEPAFTSPAEWWYWRIDQGVVGTDKGAVPHPTAMPAWRFILDDQEKWEIVYYARDLVGTKAGDQ